MAPRPAVGVVGLGTMGGGIAARLVAAGYAVAAYDVRPAAVRAAAGAGARPCGTAAELAGRCEVVVTSLPSAAALEAVAAELGRSPGRVRVAVEASTLAVEDKVKARDVLAAAGIALADAPISGTGAQLRGGDAVVYASGDPEVLERCRPVMEAYARKVLAVGGFGDGSRLKLVANLLVAVHNVAAAEALALAGRIGLDPPAVLAALAEGAGTSRMLEVRGPMMVEREYQPATMRVELFGKDLALIAALARASGATTPLFDASVAVYAEAEAGGHGDDDTASVLEVFLKRAPT